MHFFKRIAVKICVSILIIETIVLILLGVFYVRKFNREIDQRVHDKLILPGILMSQRALNYDSVNDYKVINDLIQEDILLAFIARESGDIYYAADDRLIGEKIDKVLTPEEHQKLIADRRFWYNPSFFKTKNGVYFLSVLSPILHGERVLGHLYIRVDAENIEREKRQVALIFVFGSLLAIVVTSLVEAVFIHQLFVPRIRNISKVLQMVQQGDLSQRVTDCMPEDELYKLINLVNNMLNHVSTTIYALTDTQRALAASEERFRDLADMLPEGVFEIDRTGYFTYVNFQLCKISQYSREELYDRVHYEDLLVEEHTQEAVLIFKELLNGGNTESREFVLRCKDGSLLPAMINASPIDQHGETRGLRGIVVDLTEQNRLQRELLQAQKMESIGRLSASVAHEFGNPLIGLHYMLENLQLIPNLDESQKKLLLLGLSECKRLDHLIKNFQSFAKPSVEKKSIIDINLVIDDVLLLYKKYLVDKRVDVTENFQRNLPGILAVKDQIHQVIVNILMNAVDSLDEENREIVITTLYREKQVLIIIKDKGCGIAEENVNRIFEPFYSSKAEVEGTGLGLYVSYLIIKNHQGDVQVESARGEGSSFTIKLPAEDDKTMSSQDLLDNLQHQGS